MNSTAQGSWALPSDCLYTLQLSSYTDVVPYFRQHNIGVLQASLNQKDLWYEADMLGRLLYKNTSQHRGSHLMRTLRAVNRQLRLLRSLNLPELLADLDKMLQLASTPASNPLTSSSGFRSGFGAQKQTHRVPCQEACAAVMQRIVGGAWMCQGLVGACLDTAQHSTAQIAKSFFMPLCVTVTAMLARIQALVMQMLQACLTAYNNLAGLLPLLPTAAVSGSQTALEHSKRLAALPQSLECSWSSAKLPQIKTVTPDAELTGQATAKQQTWVFKEANKLWDELGLLQGLEAVYVGPSDMADAPPTSATPQLPNESDNAEQQPQAVSLAATLEPCSIQVDMDVGTPVNINNDIAWQPPAERTQPSTVKAAAVQSHQQIPSLISAKKMVGAKQGFGAAKAVASQTTGRRSFFEMMGGSAPTTGRPAAATSQLTAGLSTALPTGATNAFIDRGAAGLTASKRQKQAGSDRHNDAALKPSVASTNMAGPVYTSGFSLGLTTHPKPVSQPSPDVQDASKPSFLKNSVDGNGADTVSTGLLGNMTGRPAQPAAEEYEGSSNAAAPHKHAVNTHDDVQDKAAQPEVQGKSDDAEAEKQKKATTQPQETEGKAAGGAGSVATARIKASKSEPAFLRVAMDTKPQKPSRPAATQSTAAGVQASQTSSWLCLLSGPAPDAKPLIASPGKGASTGSKAKLGVQDTTLKQSSHGKLQKQLRKGDGKLKDNSPPGKGAASGNASIALFDMLLSK